jgi:hypothetical protein
LVIKQGARGCLGKGAKSRAGNGISASKVSLTCGYVPHFARLKPLSVRIGPAIVGCGASAMFRQSPIFSQNNALLNVKTGCSPDFAEKVQLWGVA